MKARGGAALAGFARLEAVGRFAETPEAGQREILLSMGDAALILSDFNETPFDQWPLASLRRMRDRQGVLLLAPDDGAPERLELADPQMIAALREIGAAAQAPGRRRRGLSRRARLAVSALGVVTALAAAAASYPGALARLADRFPQPAQAALGDAALRIYAPDGFCPAGPDARAALRALAGGFADISRIAVARGAGFSAVGPGGRMALFETEIAAMADAQTLSRAVGAAAARARADDPMRLALERAGLVALWRIAVQGADSADLVAEAAAAMRAQAARPATPVAPSAPFSPPPGAWRALKNICGSGG